MQSLRPTGPTPPFATWPVQLSAPDVGFAWYVGDGVFITQATTSIGDERVATTISDWIDACLDEHRIEIGKAGGLLAIHDWRRIKTYESDARTIWFARIKRRPKGYLRKAIVITNENPLLKMAIAGANLLVAVASRGEGQIEVASNAYEVLRRYNIKPPER